MTLRRAILNALSMQAPFLVPERTLFLDINVQMPVAFTITEVRAKIADLEAEKMVVSVRDDIDQVIKYRITTHGQAALLQ